MLCRVLLATLLGSGLPLAAQDDAPLTTKSKCSLTIDKGFPTATAAQPDRGWKVTAIGAYKYDPEYRFQNLQVYTSYRDRKTGKVKAGPTLEIPDERAILRGKWSATFYLAEPKADEDLRIRVVLQVVKDKMEPAEACELLSGPIKIAP